MKIDLSTGCLYLSPLAKTFRLAREIGFDGLELMVNREALRRGAEYLNKLVQVNELPISTVHPGLAYFGGWESAYKVYMDAVRLALDLPTCRLVVFHTPNEPIGTSRSWSIYRRLLADGVRLTSGTPIRIALENRAFTGKPRNEGPLGHIFDLQRLADEWQLPVTLDTAHVGSSGAPLLEVYDLLKPRIQNVHFSDFRRFPLPRGIILIHSNLRHHQRPGHGVLPLGDFLHRLRRDNYEGLVTFEISPLAGRAWSEKQVKHTLGQALTYCRHLGETGTGRSEGN